MAMTRGPRGKRGLRGAKGATGATGATGAKGTTGVKGATGAAGPIGAIGPIGKTGPAGPKMKRSEVLELVEEQFEWIRGQLDMQIKRIVELQTQLDHIYELLKGRLANEPEWPTDGPRNPTTP